MPTVVIGTAGHIDHGKSALVKALTGVDPDRLKEERERGITIDLGFAHTQVGDLTLAFVDVPGHERFVRNMLAGAGGIDAVLLVIAANESVMPQTREHFAICRLLGLARGVIAVTKVDTADADTVAIAEAEARELVAGSALSAAPIVRVSVRTGEGLDALRSALGALGGRPTREGRSGVARVPIDRAFAVKGAGVVITGTLVSGRVGDGDALAVLPAGRPVRVRGVQVHGAIVPEARAPQRVAVNLAGVDLADLHRGMTLVSPDSLAITRRIDVHLELLSDARPLRHGTRVRVHQGTGEVFGRVAIAAVRAGEGQPWQAARPGDQGVEIPPGGQAYVRLRLERPMAVTRRDRVVVRAYSPPSTIAGGVILDPEPPASGARRSSALARFERLRDEASAMIVWLDEASGRGLSAGEAVRRGGFALEQAQQAFGAVVASGQAIALAGRLFPAAAAVRLRDRIESTLEDFHRRASQESGMSRETLRSQVTGRDAPALFDAALDALLSAGVVRGQDRIALTTFAPAVPAAEFRMRQDLEAMLRASGLTPAEPSAVASALGASETAVESALRGLVREGRVVRAGTLCFHAEALAALKADLRAWREGQASGARLTVDVATFKSRYGLTRKFAIPLLEWLDRERVTRRVGETRILL